MPACDRSLVWFRRDLRIEDHAALCHALRSSRAVYCAFVFDTTILDALPRRDRRVEFIHRSVAELDARLREHGGALIVQHGDACLALPRLARELQVDVVFANEDYEPAAIARDEAVAERLQADGRRLSLFKDHVIFGPDEILTQVGTPYSVFTPYKNAWLKKCDELPGMNEPGNCFAAWPLEHAERLARHENTSVTGSLPTLAELGFEETDLDQLKIQPGTSGAEVLLDDFADRIGRYDRQRDYPGLKGPSYLSVHLRFGTISIRQAARVARDAMRRGENNGAATWLSELIWRDFYFMILFHHPHVAQRAFKPEYDRIAWETGPDADERFNAWCEGRTGYPLVDAAMAQLNRSGYMHNRLRMVSACFLVKDLGIDWRRGERYFAEKLNDFDLAANNGGWQWAASSGCDAQPWFRIFNPITQSEKFDADGRFIRRYLPQLAKLPDKHLHAPWKAPADVLNAAGIALGIDYPLPIVQHDAARLRTLERYAVVKKAL